jgi:hypothetical protein
VNGCGGQRRAVHSAGAGLALLASHGAVHGAEWTIAPQAQLHAVAESNPRMVDAANPAHESARALSVGAALDATRRTELTALTLGARIAQRRYDQDSALDRLDIDTTLGLQGASERLTWSTRAFARRDTTLTSELGLSGSTSAKSRHEALGGNFDARWSSNERLFATVGTAVQFDAYPGNESGLLDYRYRSAQLGGGYVLSPRSQLQLSAHAGELDVSSNRFASQDSSLQLRYSIQPSERFNASVFIGPTWVKGTSNTETGRNFGANIGRTGERLSLALSAERRIAPTGRGLLTERDDASLNMAMRLSERWNANLAYSYIRSRDLLSGYGFELEDVRYQRIEGGLSWNIGRKWSAAIRAGHSTQRVASSRSTGSGYSAQLGVVWEGGARGH